MAHLPKHPYLAAWICWLIVTASTLLFALPKIRTAIRQSGVLELVEARGEGTDNKRELSLCFYNSSMEETIYKQWQKRMGGDLYHDTLEGLLSGPDKGNVRLGAASFIDPRTKLLGCTLSSRVLFVDLSKEFGDSPDMDKAVRQVERSMCGYEAVDKVVILLDGEPLSQLPDE